MFHCSIACSLVRASHTERLTGCCSVQTAQLQDYTGCHSHGVPWQDILGSDHAVDKSGNPILKDAGVWLRDELKAAIPDTDMKYIDPSYLIRSIPTISGDRIYCKVCMANQAAHGCGRVGRESSKQCPADQLSSMDTCCLNSCRGIQSISATVGLELPGLQLGCLHI